MSVSAISVKPLPLIITRSYTCSMYSVGVSIKTLTKKLKTPTQANSRRNLHITRPSRLRVKKPWRPGRLREEISCVALMLPPPEPRARAS